MLVHTPYFRCTMRRMDAQPLRLLVVDDDLPLIEALERGFTEAGWDVVAHTTFEGARQALRSERFDAMLTDVRLGALTGFSSPSWPATRFRKCKSWCFRGSTTRSCEVKPSTSVRVTQSSQSLRKR